MSHQKAFDSDAVAHNLYGDDKKLSATHLENNSEDNSVNGGNVGHVYMSPEEKQSALAAAQLVDPGLNPWSMRGLLFGLSLIPVLACGGDNGFDGTIMSSVNSMVQYQKYFGLSAAGAKTGIVFGIYTVGGVVAFIPASILPDKLGRRWSMFLGNVVLIAGAIITANAKNTGMFLGGRFLTGLGCTTASTSAKSYMTEVTSPASRGRFMALLNSFYYVGQILASGVAIPLGRMNNDWSWRASLYLQGVLAVLNVLFVLLLPESPRWLYAQGKREQAIQVLANLHSRDRDVDSPLIKFEINEIEENISLTGADKRWWDFRRLFQTRSDRYRLGIALIVSVWGQLSGNGLITYFLPVLLQQAGITSPDRQRVLSFVNSVTSFIGALCGSAVVDHVGRRRLMLFASFCCLAGMFIVAGLLSPAGKQSGTRATAGITFIYLFMVLYSVGWTPNQGLYPAEVFAHEVRAKGIAFQGLATQAVSCINTFGLPPALAAIRWKTYLIFGCWDVVGIIVIWLFVVETRQIPLEDLNAIFEAPNPRKASQEVLKARKARAAAEKASRV